MEDGAASKTSGQGRTPFFARLLDRFRRGAEEAPAVPSQGPAAKAAPAPKALPPPDPLTVRQWLYGPGYVIPGNADYVLELVKSFNLSPAMTTLDMGAGLGGPARTIAEVFKTYIAGFERDPDLARRAEEMSTVQGLGRHVQINPYDPETFELRTAFYDHALAREATYHIVQKERFLRVVNQAMKPSGQLVMTDFVRDRTAGDRPELAAWEAMQRYKPELWTSAQYADCLKSLGFDLRIATDFTADYRHLIIHAWKEFVERPELHHLRSSQASPVIDEVERGVRTIAALESGALKFFYFVALGGRRRGPTIS